MGSQQLLVPPTQICQALAVGASSPGQLSLTAVMCPPNVLQSGFQECPKGCGCRLWACTICILLEEIGLGWGGSTPCPPSSLHGAGLTTVCWVGLKSPTRSESL